MILAAVIVGPKVQAQGVITITVGNPSFEDPKPALFSDYTIGATGWTVTRGDVPAGTFDPAVAGTTPAAVDGTQVGFANGFGGLQQVLGTTFTTGTIYYFSSYVGLRADNSTADTATAAVQLGYFTDGTTFNLLSSQSLTVAKGDFDLLSGSYVATGAVAGQTMVLRLVNIADAQVIFDQVAVSATPIPEPSVIGAALGAMALGCAIWRRRQRRVEG